MRWEAVRTCGRPLSKGTGRKLGGVRAGRSMAGSSSSIVALRPFFTESLNSAAVPTWISYRATGAGELVSGATSVPG